jgi:CubicO group peptidase (beta-lactamase class C family)
MRPGWRWALLTIASVLSVAVLRPAQTPARATAPPAATSGFDLARLARIDDVVREAIAAKKLPGAVVVVGRGDTIVWRKAYGERAVQPSPEPMTLDTIFDMASLTKVVATTPAVMKLVEDGKIRLTDPVASFIPEFGKYGKDRVTVRDLLTHTSGLRPDLDLGDDWSGYETGVNRATEEVLSDRRFVYSDINFLLLAEIVARVSKQPFDEFVRTQIFRSACARRCSAAGLARAENRADAGVPVHRQVVRRSADAARRRARSDGAGWAASRAMRACSAPRRISPSTVERCSAAEQWGRRASSLRSRSRA